MQFTTTAHFKNRFVIGEFHAHGDIGLQLTFQAFANLAAGDVFTFTACQGTRVDLEVHRQSRFIHLQKRQRFRFFKIGNGGTDRKFFNTIDQHDVACLSRIHKLAIQPFKHQDLIDLHLLGGIIGPIHNADIFACVNATAVHTADTDLTHIARVIQRANLKLQGTVGIVIAYGHFFNHGIENGAHIAHFLQLFNIVAVTGDTFQGRAINHREVQLLFGCTQLIEKIEGLVQNPVRTGARAVNLIDDHNGLQTESQSFARNKARLRHRAFHGIDQQKHPVDHRKNAFDFTAEVRMPRGINNVNVSAFVFHSTVFSQNRNAALTFQITAVHHTFLDFLIGTESAGCAQQFVNQGGLTMVNVRDNRDIANSTSISHLSSQYLSCWQLIVRVRAHRVH